MILATTSIEKIVRNTFIGNSILMGDKHPDLWGASVPFYGVQVTGIVMGEKSW